MVIYLLCQNLLSGVNQPQSAFSLKSVLNNIIALGLDGEHMCYLIARVGWKPFHYIRYSLLFLTIPKMF